MQARPPLCGAPAQQLCFGGALFEAPAPARVNRRVRRASASQAARPNALVAASPARPDTPLACAPARGASRAVEQDDFATEAPANAYEQRARLRNSLTALSTATDLMVRHAPDSPVLVELSAVVRRQIAQLTQQIQALEQIAAHCESADI